MKNVEGGLLRIVSILGAFSALSGVVPGIAQSTPASQTWQESKLIADDGAIGDSLGSSVSIWGDSAIAGAPAADIGGQPNSGAAYVFTRVGGDWQQEAKLIPSDGAYADSFGTSVSIWGDRAIVGAPGANVQGEFTGAAYVFVRNGGVWVEQAKLVPGGQSRGWDFGTSVALSGSTTVIGAPGAWNPHGIQPGAAYVYSEQNGKWIEEAELLPATASDSAEFGTSVAILGNTLIGGARYHEVGTASLQGGAWVYRKSDGQWLEDGYLVASDGEAGDFFGAAVAVVADQAVVGAWADDENGTFSGSAYVFERMQSGWVEQTKLLPSDGAAGDRFGAAVSIRPARIAVGAHTDDNALGYGAGSVYVFKKASQAWLEDATLTASDGEGSWEFGRAVSLSPGGLLVGAPRADGGIAASGAAYVFEEAGPRLTVSGVCPGPVTVNVAEGPPGSEVAVIAAGGVTGFTKGGVLCNGTRLEIGEPFQLPPTWVRIDGQGNGRGGLQMQAETCWLEALAVATCTPSGSHWISPQAAPR